MRLDFSRWGRLSAEHSRQLNQAAMDITEEFNSLAAKLFENQRDPLAWALCSPAERNPLASPFFFSCCVLMLLDRLLARGVEVSAVVVESPALQQCVDQLCAKHNVRTQTILKASRRPQVLEAWKQIVGQPLRALLSYCLARLTPGPRSKPTHRIILIDYFVLENHLSPDRYYPGLTEGLSEPELCRIYYLPSFYGVSLRKMRAMYKRLRTAEFPCVLKEDYLRISDYWRAWRRALGVRPGQVPRLDFLGMDVSSLAAEEIRARRGFGSQLAGLLNASFPRRLVQANVHVDRFINWFENQPIDRGLHAGFLEYSSHTLRVGYLGTIPPATYISLTPTRSEVEVGIEPQVLQVIGDGLQARFQHLRSKLRVETAPALRYQHVYTSINSKCVENRTNILVALPMHSAQALELLRCIVKAHSLLNRGVCFFLKAHPATPLEKLSQDIPLPQFFSYVQGRLEEWLARCDVMVSSASSSCLEALACGVPVAVVGFQQGLTLNTIPDSVADDFWGLCFGPEELAVELARLLKSRVEAPDRLDATSREVRKRFFKRATTDGNRCFLGLDRRSQS